MPTKGVALKLDRGNSNRQEKNDLLNAYFKNKQMLKSWGTEKS